MVTRWLSLDLSPRHLALLALLFNLPFLLLRVHRSAFDTYTHIFFADHYRQSWWSLWEPRWYLGFSVASYPPLVHQLIALLSWPLSALITAFAPQAEPFPNAFRWLGEEAAYVLILLAVLGLFPLAVRDFARVFVGPRAAGWAAGLGIVLPALSLTAWAFGQLPTLAATLLILFALARGARFLHSGDRWALAQAAAFAAVAAATHHAAFLFVPFAGLAVVGQHLWRDRRRALQVTMWARVLAWATLSAVCVLLVLWPFLQWSRGQTLQTPIDHASRYNFLLQPQATMFFFWPVYGALLLMLPLAAWLAWRWPRFRAPFLAFAVLFVLSLGGTTPLPRWLFGAGWEWLTYDRFGLWASVMLLPFAGALVSVWIRGAGRRGMRGALAFIGAMLLTSLASGFLSVSARSQPPAIDLAPLVRFLDEPAQRPYRYLTLGFGDQAARLAALTANGTPDGSYHTARGLPELRRSGLGALDGAVWNPLGEWAVQPFLSEPGRYGVRWVFSFHPRYGPVLRASGWTFRFMVGEVQAWERADVEPLEAPAPPEDEIAARWWGAAPLLVLIAVLLLQAWPARRAVTRVAVIQGLARVRGLLFALMVILLSLWWVHVLRGAPGDLPHIYFVHQSVLVYASDVALGLTLAVWITERGLRREPLRVGPRAVWYAGLALIVAAAFSMWASPDRALTLALVMHLMLLAILFVMLVNDPPSPSTLGGLFAGVILAQSAMVMLQVMAQDTASVRGLNVMWPGVVTAETRGASVVANVEGVRWLRAYGTLSHPNLLGALLLVYLGAVAERYLTTGRRAWLAVISAGALSLCLTFSRAAWIGALTGAAALLWLLPRRVAHRSRLALAVGSCAALLAAVPLASFVLARTDVAGQRIALERASTLERTLLMGYSLQAWRAQPLTGVGAAGFVQWAARTIPERYPFQPVHSLPLLVLAETGLLGGAAMLALVAAVAWRVWRRRGQVSVAEAVWSAVLLGVCVTGLFDHLWWTQPPARTLLVVALGLWAADVKKLTTFF